MKGQNARLKDIGQPRGGSGNGPVPQKRLDIKIGFHCNNFCLFCPQGDKRNIHPQRELADMVKDLEDARSHGIRDVVFTGGEPTLHNHIVEVVSMARKIGFELIQLQTNGRRLAYPQFCREIVAAGATEFSPSLHGSCPEIHDNATRSPGSWREVVAGIRNLKSLGQRVIINSVICTLNYRDLPELARLLVHLGVDQFQFAFVHIVGRAWENRYSIVPRKSDIMPYVFKGLETGMKSGVPCYTEAIPYCMMKGHEDCVAERIIPDGPVRDAGVFVKSFQDYRKTEGKVKHPKCRQCRYFGICEGPWKEYPELFGWEEFNPITTKLQ